MNLEDDQITNMSGNRPFGDVVRARVDRRQVLAGGLAAMASTFIAPSIASARTVATTEPATDEVAADEHRRGRRRGRRRNLIGFEPVPVAEASGPNPHVSSDYTYQIIIPWGTPILAPYPEHVNGAKTAADQEKQIGLGHDGMHFFPRRYRSDRGTLAVNHEFGRNAHIFWTRGATDEERIPTSLDDVRLSQAAHGVSMVELKRNRKGTWDVVRGNRRNRRITPNTPVAFSGPVAGHPILGDPRRPSYGTVNNCSSGATPWGTYVTCEENFNGYFGVADGSSWTASEAQERYGFSESGFGYLWQDYDPRWDLGNAEFANEDNRFGWCVEIDPNRPRRQPVKRTAMGRFKHEGVAFTTGRGGRVVAYMGDDQRFDYIYRYVSSDDWRAMLGRGASPLDDGALFVARFDDDGTGHWLELTIDNPVLAERFDDQAEVLTFARIAADLLGATPMDRPEWTTVAPNGDVYCTLTNNSQREETGPGSPLAPNPDGHIIRWRDDRRHTGTTFEWDIFLIAQDTHGTEDTFSDPDGLWADPDGRLFIQTDGDQTDGGDEVVLNNQMLVADPRTGELRRLLSGVTGDEITGIAYTPDRRTLFANSQHPGDGDPTATNFPVRNDVPDGVTIPRDATYVLTRNDGGIVGS